MTKVGEEMFSVPSLYEMGSCSDSYDILPAGIFMSSRTDVENGNLSPRSMAEAKAAAASNSHKEAERRRRKRINGHIATLKTILPNAIKVNISIQGNMTQNQQFISTYQDKMQN